MFDTFAVAGTAAAGCTVVAVEHTAAAAVGRIVVVVVDIVEMVPSSLAPRAFEHRELRLRNSHKQGVCPIPGCKKKRVRLQFTFRRTRGVQETDQSKGEAEDGP